MNYRRALFVAVPARDPGPALAVLRRVAPGLERVLLLLPGRAADGATALGAGPTAELEALRAAAAGVAPSLEVRRVPRLAPATVIGLCVAEGADLLVFASSSLRSAAAVAAHRAKLPVAVLWAEGPATPGPLAHLACVALDPRAKAAVETFLRDHVDPTVHLSLLAPSVMPPENVATARQVSGIMATVEFSSRRAGAPVRRWLEERARVRPVDLFVCARVPMTVLVGGLQIAPTLLVPWVSSARPRGRVALDVADVVNEGGPLRVRVDHFAAPAHLTPAPDGETLAFVAGGRVVATAAVRAGEAELPVGLEASALGVSRAGAGGGAELVAAAEECIVVVRPTHRPLLLFDAEIPAATVQAFVRSKAGEAVDLVAVRMRPTRGFRAIRARLAAAGLPAVVLDARTVLEEGDAFDVSQLLDPLRLARVGSRLRRAGFAVAAIQHGGPLPPTVQDFAAFGPIDFASDVEVLPAALPAPLLPAPEPVPALPAATIEGNRVELEFDNGKARRWLLDAIAGATESLHFQTYMALDDDVGGPVEAALAAAGARGVAVRVLVDSLHGLHGSLGKQNPVLARLAGRPGVELRVVRPIAQLPSLVDLKQRDHRKLAVADGRVALLGGRNLSHEYYTAFDEVALTAASPWREVPWLDAGARVEGPAVEALGTSFREAWLESGGADFVIRTSAPVGTTRARVVVHRGLRDACTLEAYRSLIDGARAHICVVNGFPFVLELQHALLRALGRGVRVRVLTGHLTPTHAGQPFSGPMSSARTAATDFVHSRVDPIVAAGGEVYLFARRDVPGWAPGLGLVYAHVHAKALSVDGRRCAVGSANLDITASYWESEVMLVVEDADVVRGFEAELDALMSASTRVERDDPAWQRLARRRAWMRHWPGVLAI